jgi:hypothetical protein
MSTLLRSRKVAVDDPSRERGASTKRESSIMNIALYCPVALHYLTSFTT